jgi:hypothetical protein
MHRKILVLGVVLLIVVSLAVFFIQKPTEEPKHNPKDIEIFLSDVDYVQEGSAINLEIHIENPTNREVRGKLQVKQEPMLTLKPYEKDIIIEPYGNYSTSFSLSTSTWDFNEEVHIYFRDEYLDITYIDQWVHLEKPKELIKILGTKWSEINGSLQCQLNIKNSEFGEVTIVEVRVNDETPTTSPETPFTISANDEAIITVSIKNGFVSGVKYQFSLISARGNEYTYVSTAP